MAKPPSKFNKQGKGGHNRHKGSPPPSLLPSPYNFAPLPEKVFFPSEHLGDKDPNWKFPPSQDLPFRDGVCGHIEVTLTTHTSTFIRSSKGKDDPSFFQIEPTGEYAIPGTSLKGMIRSLIEPLSFSRLAPIRETTIAYRDLSNSENEYLRFFKNNEPHAGWLEEQKEGSWTITPCDWLKLEHEDIVKTLRGPDLSPVKSRENRKAPQAKDKYRMWDKRFKSDRTVFFTRRSGSTVAQLSESQGSDTLRGTVVFVGSLSLPNDEQKKKGLDQNKGYKHRDYLFYDRPDARPIPLSETDCRRFEQAHRIDEKRRSPNWEFHRKDLKKGKRIPVFYHSQNGRVSSFGLARLYRLPYEHTTTSLLQKKRKGEQGASDLLDFTETLFGRVTKDNNSLKGRIQFETLFANGTPELAETVEDAVLGQPRATFHPAYLEQSGRNGKTAGYETWNDKSGATNLRGWKRYPVRKSADWRTHPPETGGKVNTDVATSFTPLQEGTSFSGRIHLHNLRPAELGALLWALTWGGNENLRHKIGYAKPFGHGSASLSITTPLEQTLRANSNKQDIHTLESYLDSFESLMREATADWGKDTWDKERSPTLVQLQKMADPESEWELERVKYPALKQFSKIKNEKLFLRRHCEDAPPPKVVAPIGNEQLKGEVVEAEFGSEGTNKRGRTTYSLRAVGPDGTSFTGSLSGQAKTKLPEGFGPGWKGRVKVTSQPNSNQTGAEFDWSE